MPTFFLGYISPAQTVSQAAIGHIADWAPANLSQAAQAELVAAFAAGRALDPANIRIRIAAEDGPGRWGYGVVVVECANAIAVQPMDVLLTISREIQEWRTIEWHVTRWEDNFAGGGGAW